MGRSQRRKGGRGERYVVNVLKEAGFAGATRNYADKVDGLGTDVRAGALRIQVKNWNKSVPMNKYDEVAGDDGIPALVSNNTSKRSQPWLITLSLDDFLAICQDVGLVWQGENNG